MAVLTKTATAFETRFPNALIFGGSGRDELADKPRAYGKRRSIGVSLSAARNAASAATLGQQYLAVVGEHLLLRKLLGPQSAGCPQAGP